MFAVFAILFASGLSAQVVNIPDKAKEDFSKKHANAKDVDWENRVTYYLVHFTEEGIAATSHYRLDGTWDFTEKKMSVFPAEVMESFSKSKYRDWKINEKAFVENDNSEKLYRYEVTKGVEKKYVFFDKAGKLVKENPTV